MIIQGFRYLSYMYFFAQSPQLCEACADGDIETIKRLISNGVDVNAVVKVCTLLIISSG